MPPSPERASFLTIPSELRNAIYLYVFTPELHDDDDDDNDTKENASNENINPLTTALNLPTDDDDTPYHNNPSKTQLRLLQTCRQIHSEAHLLALSTTTFHLRGETPYPDCFAFQASPLRAAKLAAIRHLTLTTRITSLRALNETWNGIPFGCTHLRLETLTVVPTRADSSRSAYAEVSDLSQSHTLSYVFAETLKGLRNVGVVRVRNGGCFNDVVWRLVYRSLVYRLWRWGGGRCGVRFECSEDDLGGREWFKVFLREEEDCEGREVGDEVVRLVGATGELPDPNLLDL